MARQPHIDNGTRSGTNLSYQNVKLKCMQVNLQHSRVAVSNQTQVIVQYNADIAFAQEPYTIHNNVAGFPKSFKIYKHGGGRKRAAIIINNKEVDAIAITQGSHEDAILTEIRRKGLRLFGASLYLPIDRDMERDLDTIENIHQFTKGEGLILAIDSNARNRLWFDKYTNARRRTLEDYIITRDLHILNKETGIPSFETNRGRSWIDLTLCNSKLIQDIRRWTCGEEESCADHKIIFFDIESMGAGGDTTHYLRKRYKTKTANWGTFDLHLAQSLAKNFGCRTNPNNFADCDKDLRQKVKNSADTGKIIHKFTSAVTAACDASFQVLRPGKRASKERSVPWWNNELKTLRKKTLAMRRRYQRTKCNANLRQERKLQYQESNRTYQAKLREAKSKSWKDFCSRTQNSNPWNLVYRYAAGKTRNTLTWTTLKANNNTYTADIQCTLNQLMDYFIPEDLASSDETHCQRARQLTTEPLNTPDDIPFTKHEIRAVLEKFDPRKAPGEDAVSSEVLLRAFRNFPTFFTEVYNECLKRGHFPNYWKRSIIQPIVKPGKEELSEVHKYRPISLINTGGKILEKLLIDRINHHLHTNKLLNSNQFGFTPQSYG